MDVLRKLYMKHLGRNFPLRFFILFSDAPGRISKAARSVFKSLVALGEDPMHLIFSSGILLGRKTFNTISAYFRITFKIQCCLPLVNIFYTYRSNLQSSVEWPRNPLPDTRTPEQWSEFCALPFDNESGFQSYVNELATISATFVEWMDKRNSKGVSALKILQNAATRPHCEFLQNSSRLIAYLGDKAARLVLGRYNQK